MEVKDLKDLDDKSVASLHNTLSGDDEPEPQSAVQSSGTEYESDHDLERGKAEAAASVEVDPNLVSAPNDKHATEENADKS